RIAIIQKDKCNPIGCGNYLCARLCPVNREGTECISVGPDKKAFIDEKLCTGCGICPNRCPFGAISIINLPEQLDAPIHRYGQNGFHLYNLPIPIFGKVVGIVGRNGIGKSTAIKILAGSIKPNLGADNPEKQDIATELIIKRFRGTEAQAYFERLKKGLKVSFKPQQVDLIPRTTTGTVKSLLEKVDERKALQEVCSALDLQTILSSKIETLSGGELQRVAIAATALKQADVYFFDEPTSFLDMKQRLKVSSFIRSLVNSNTAVLIVEHDLIILDAMTDLVHVMYGKEQCYGVVALPKSSKEGINTYLEGFLREENMRFRDKTINFLSRVDRGPKKTPLFVEWSEVQKQFGQFHLSAAIGGLRQDEVIGVVGENGTGKTSFVKLLAGVENPDNGSISGLSKISYKPQYLEAGSVLVATVLERALERFEVQLIRPLELKGLLTRKLDELSGGELQRVAIAHCLSQDANLFLLDEPSAYLDIEQRLALCRILRDFAEHNSKTVLVVDHDLLFIDYVSDELLVFTGTPAKKGVVEGPLLVEKGMNCFLQTLGVTFRKDAESGRPRVNKPESVLDREQKAEGKLYG
ncbi:MAG: ribosome biogenesis/translation initiation ATPase RLI, partial [Candidatus Woesearchaeota archaeon]|nr:ribosome biogenesis/translation initiation ATPase RLI [Candidatus Woesearchaeota archaeon]